MSDPTSAENGTVSRKLIASGWHLALVMLLIGLNAYRSTLQAMQMNADQLPNRLGLYGRTIVVEWLVLLIVVLGVWWRGTSLEVIFGKSWKSPMEAVRDIGIGAALWFVVLVVVGILGGPHGGGQPDRGIAFLLPQTVTELGIWLLVSISAGICEEANYRGYLQRQFSALTESRIAGILMSSLAFGAVHLYQGRQRALIIAISAVVFGAVAEWRQTVRPGMFAHALQDGIAPILIWLMRR